MKLSKQRKAYLGVLGLGLVALVVDRGLGSSATSPSSASAGDAVPARAPEAGDALIRSTAGGPTVAERLDTLRDRATLGASPDAFARIPSWYESGDQPTPGTTENPSSTAYRLSSVFTDRDGKAAFAIVNGQTIALSEEVGGIRLIDAGGTKGTTPGFATIEVGGQRIELRTKEAATRGEVRVQPRK